LLGRDARALERPFARLLLLLDDLRPTDRSVRAVIGGPKRRRRFVGDKLAPKKGGQFGEVVGCGRLLDVGALSAICLPIAARQIARQSRRAGLSRFFSPLRGSLSVCPICLSRHRCASAVRICIFADRLDRWTDASFLSCCFLCLR